MFKNVVVGVDEHEHGRDAIALATRLVQPGGTLTLAHVHHGYRVPVPSSNPEFETEERERARELLETAREEAGIDAQLRWRGSSSAGRGLHELTEAIGADLLVTGSSRRGLLGRVLVADDTRAALTGAPCAVAIAPAGYALETVVMREIGVAYNGTVESEHAISVARELAVEHDAKLSAFEAVSLPTYVAVAGPAPLGGAIEDLVDRARQRLAALDGIEPHAAYGSPAEELALYSASLDLLIVGSRDYGPIGRLIHGSTAQELARSARCPLLVLTRAARKGDMPPASDAGQEASVPITRGH